MKPEKLTPEQREERKTARRAKRSAFLSRMMDEFKKIGFVATFVFCVIIITWCMVLYTISLVSTDVTIIPAVASALQIISVTAFGIIGTAFAFYCKAATDDKKSLNDNGLVKNKDGTFTKIMEAASTVASTIIPKKSNSTDDDVAG